MNFSESFPVNREENTSITVSDVGGRVYFGAFFPSRKQGTGRSDSHRISMMDVSSARAGAFKSAPPQLGRIRPTPWTHTRSLCWWLLFSASFHTVGSSLPASPASSTAHTLAHFTSSIRFSSLLHYCHCCIVVFCSANLELCYLFAEGQLC